MIDTFDAHSAFSQKISPSIVWGFAFCALPSLIGWRFDYLSAFAGYFTKNYGLNTITAAVLPAVVQTVAVGSTDAANLIASSLAPQTVGVINQGGAAGITAGVLIVMRIGLALFRAK